jgi:hypothetical protein
MAGSTVNLDALIPRDDFVSEQGDSGGSPRTTISLSELDRDGFFQNSMRKPDFQRETTHWSPATVVDLIRAFLDRDLIPAVNLWERGNEHFVIDGAHRLSALIAWIRDDYGDRSASYAMFGSGVTDEQKRVAERTRAAVKKEIGTYAEFRGLLGQTVADSVTARRISSIGKNAIQIQWVTATTAEAAEKSFFKINQAAQPIDPVERRILQSRKAPNAIAARCIARGGGGHKYWSGFAPGVAEKIEALGAEIHADLYLPPSSQPVTTADQPIAGRGYNALPFVFNLVSLCNGLKIPPSMANKKIEEALPDDPDGSETVKFLENVKSMISLVSTKHPKSLGFHPLIYYYAKSGVFLSNAFLASLLFARKLDAERRRDDFTKVRRKFEDYLYTNKLFVTLTISRLGSGSRSLTRIEQLYWKIFQGLHEGKSYDELFEAFVKSQDFEHLKLAEISPPSAELTASPRGASRETKSAAFITAAMSSPVRCHICDGAIHLNSMTIDHLERVRDGGGNRSENLRPAHPYCNSGFKA